MSTDLQPTGALRFEVPGAVHFFALDSEVTEKAAEAGWPEPELVRRGRGWTAVYHVTSAVRADMLAWVRLCAEGLVGETKDRSAERALEWVRAQEVK